MSAELQRARALLEVGRWEQAQEVLGGYLAGAPQSVEALCLLARSHQLARNFQAMLAAANQAVAAGPTNEWAHRLRSIALGKLRLRRDSEEAARQAVTLAPGAWQPYVILVDALLAHGTAAHRREAFRVAGRAAELAPQEPEVHNSRGRVFQAISDPAAARRCYQHALSLDPQNPTAQNNLAVVELRRGRTTAAGRRLGGVLAERPTETLYQDNARATAKVWAYRLMEVGTAAWLAALAVAAGDPPWPVRLGLAVLILAGYALGALRQYRRLSPALRRLVATNRAPLVGAAVQAATVPAVALLWESANWLGALLLPLLLLSIGFGFVTVLRLRVRLLGRLIVFGRRWWYRLVVLKQPR